MQRHAEPDRRGGASDPEVWICLSAAFVVAAVIVVGAAVVVVVAAPAPTASSRLIIEHFEPEHATSDARAVLWQDI